jgi:2-polyprenyl-6-methoxyphenol hydroxylase-like FAD-dependent oxidoreductase
MTIADAVSRTATTDVAIVGAGPYGLSIAAHVRAAGVSVRIFGKPMEVWREQMPRGMVLKSEGFASDLYDPDAELTLRHYCAEHGLEYADVGTPVKLQTFVRTASHSRGVLFPNSMRARSCAWSKSRRASN